MIMKSSPSTVVLIALVVSSTQAFTPNSWGNGNSHVTITKKAIMAKISEVCEIVAKSEGREFKPTGPSEEELLYACLGAKTGEVSSTGFLAALNQIYMQNVIVDRDFMSSPMHHFNNEAFTEGHELISQGKVAIEANVRSGNLQSAREILGRVCHTLQDFYSHSNWVELGNKSPYANLLRPDLTIENVTDLTMPTCSDCASGNCPNPLLPAILNGRYLTSGYMGLYSSDKPQGKCSHGGDADLSSTQIPRGGISKDESHPYNADLHNTSVNLATQSTMDLIDVISRTVGYKDFLRLMGIARPVVVVFVIDTTASMVLNLDNVKEIASSIIDSKQGTLDEPSEYILVEFNEPAIGPLIKTTDPGVMKSEISKLKGVSGGNKMCLSALQLALIGAPSYSHIYVFTDDSPNDVGIEKTIINLIRNTKSMVSFLVQVNEAAQPPLEIPLYHEIALASGGQFIKVSRSSMTLSASIFANTCTSKLVTIMQSNRNPGQFERFSFYLDKSVSNVTIYYTAIDRFLYLTLYSPSGLSQSGSSSPQPLATALRVGDVVQFKLKVTEVGFWHIDMRTETPYMIKVIGQSTNTFIYDFVEEFKGPHPGYAVIDGRPQEALPAKLLLTLTGERGPEFLEVQQVAIVNVSGITMFNETVEKINDRQVLVTFNKFPEGDFFVLLKGKDKTTGSSFYRQSTTQMSYSKLTIKVTSDEPMRPGQKFQFNYTLATSGKSGLHTIRVMNDKDYIMEHTKKLHLESGGSAVGRVSLTPPADTVSGTEVTFIIEAEGPDGIDSNHALHRLSVVPKATDLIPPQCKWFGVSEGHCGGTPCDTTHWSVSVNITDGNGTGAKYASIVQGNGILNKEPAEDGGIPMIMGYYLGNCCKLNVALHIEDDAGNENMCTYSYIPKPTGGSANIGLTLPLWACLFTSTMGLLSNTFNL